VYHLFSTARHDYVRVAADCPSDEEPALPTMSGLWPGADWHERECFDFFGVKFENHPDLKPLLLPDDLGIHPLLKDKDRKSLFSLLPLRQMVDGKT
jgi:NADH-quinone oxidoreductase subunit C